MQNHTCVTSWALIDFAEEPRFRRDVNFSSDADFPVEIPEEPDENATEVCFSSKLKLTFVADRPSSVEILLPHELHQSCLAFKLDTL